MLREKNTIQKGYCQKNKNDSLYREIDHSTDTEHIKLTLPHHDSYNPKGKKKSAQGCRTVIMIWIALRQIKKEHNDHN